MVIALRPCGWCCRCLRGLSGVVANFALRTWGWCRHRLEGLGLGASLSLPTLPQGHGVGVVIITLRAQGWGCRHRYLKALGLVPMPPRVLGWCSCHLHLEGLGLALTGARNFTATAYAGHSRALISVSYSLISPDLWLILADLLHLLLYFFLHYPLLHLLCLDLGRGPLQLQKGLQKGPRPRKVRANSGSFLVGLWSCLFSLMVCALCLNGVSMNLYCG